MVELKNVSKYYNNNGVVNLGLRNINLKLNKNEIVAIVGDSGSGKSTLLNVICGIDSYEDGEMLFKGNETSYFNQTDMDVYRKENVGFIFQNYNIIESYTVLENVMIPMILNDVPKEEAKQRAIELIDKVGLSKRINNKGTKLSGGEKQRCVIARALASDCDILACDEPTGNLDTKSSIEIIKLIKEVAENKLVLIVTHNYEEVQDIVTRKIKIADGTIVEDYVISKIDNEEYDTENNVEYKGISKANLFKLSLMNVKNTPKKTIFTFMVFLFMSLIAFYLFLTCMQSSQESVFNPDTNFSNYAHNRLIIFNQDHSPITNDDYKKIEGTIIENAYYEDLICSLDIYSIKPSVPKKSYYFSYTTYQNMDYELITGNYLNDIEEVLILLPKEKLDNHTMILSSYVGGQIYVGSDILTIVGLASSDNVKNPTIISKKDISKEFSSRAYASEVSAEFIDPETGVPFIIDRKNGSTDVPTIYCYQDMAEKLKAALGNMKFYLGDFYPIATPSKINFSLIYYHTSVIYMVMPNNYMYEFDDVYEVTIYADNPNQAYNDLKSMGYTVIRPSVDYQKVSQNQLLFIAYVAISIIIIMVLAFVSYIILSRIYISKNKDYTVFRTLGVIKNNMNFVVNAEIIMISVTASIISFASIYLLYYLLDFKYLNIVVYNNFGISMLYYITIFFFTWFIAKRFNKRLFKYSVQTSFKGEVVRND